MSDKNISPLPWEILVTHEGYWSVKDGNDKYVMASGDPYDGWAPNDIDAQYIVKVVNNHKKLVEMIRKLTSKNVKIDVIQQAQQLLKEIKER